MTTRRMLVTGGAGFIGVNCAAYFLKRGWEIAVIDNLLRRGAERNLAWVQREGSIMFFKVDVRDAAGVASALSKWRPDAVLHLAAQVAVTTSVVDPRSDFEVNALGTFNVLEAVRKHSPEAVFVYASTNKVYGKIEQAAVIETNGRYAYESFPNGIPETTPLDFHSPYGCSKGAADQYVLDYARIYGMRTTSFRQSCIYGPQQFGVEDQGWVAWFTIAAILGKPITIFGDGKQVRDVLFVEDLVKAYECAFNRPDRIAGTAFNIGGGPQNTLCLLELIASLENDIGRKIPLSYDRWRPGDQKVFICDISRAHEAMGWAPKTDTVEGLKRLTAWVRAHIEVLEEHFRA